MWLPKARRLVSAGAVCESLLPKRAMDFANVIRLKVRHVRELVVQLDMEARAIPGHFQLPCAKEEVHSCMRSVDRMQFRSERVYKVARRAWLAASVSV